MKAERNKTIDLSVEEEQRYLDRYISVGHKAGVSDITDKAILVVLTELPEYFADLLIAYPPYNFNKDFNGAKFKKTTD